MKKNMNLEEVKNIFDTEKVFETDSCFLVNLFGKYQPNMTFVVDKEFPINSYGRAVNPVKLVTAYDVTKNMNIDFDGDPKICFGRFWRSKKGGACFAPQDPMTAPHLYIRVSWGGTFEKSRGNDEAVDDVLYFRHTRSNGGGAGVDHWILPVGYVAGYKFDEIFSASKILDMTEIRKKYSEMFKSAEKEAEEKYLSSIREKEESKKNREKIIHIIDSVNRELEDFCLEYGLEFDPIKTEDSYFKIPYGRELLYTEENAEYLKKYSERYKNEELDRLERKKEEEKIKEKAKSLIPEATEFDCEIVFDSSYIRFKKPRRPFDFEYTRVSSFTYTEESLKKITEEIDKLKEEQLQKQRKEELKRKQDEAKKMGLPDNVRIWHRNGRTGAGKGWVITPEGLDRECDSVDNSGLSTSKKRIGYEGYHVWDQIMPGELVLKWSHAYTAAPHEFQVVYRPDNLTEAQIERVAEIQAEMDAEFDGLLGLVSGIPCPKVGSGFGLF